MVGDPGPRDTFPYKESRSHPGHRARIGLVKRKFIRHARQAACHGRDLWRAHAGQMLIRGRILNSVHPKYQNVIEESMKNRPEIIISTIDADRLDKLMNSLPSGGFMGRAELESELARARVVDSREMPPTVVTMNSTVRFKVESSIDEFELTLVYPKDVDSSGKTISILAPVGSALLGLSQGDEIEWPKPGGGVLRVQIKEVTYQPERSGEFHR